jgi:hypothetical protein
MGSALSQYSSAHRRIPPPTVSGGFPRRFLYCPYLMKISRYPFCIYGQAFPYITIVLSVKKKVNADNFLVNDRVSGGKSRLVELKGTI